MLQTRNAELHKERNRAECCGNELRGMVLTRDGNLKLCMREMERVSKERDEFKNQVFELEKEVIRARKGAS